MNFEPELWKWYHVYGVSDINNYRLFYSESDKVMYFINVDMKHEIVEPGYDVKRFLKNRKSDYDLKELPNNLQKVVVKFILEELYEV